MLSKKNWLTGLAAGVTFAFAGTASAQPAPVMNLNGGLAQPQVVGSVVASPYFTNTNGVFTAILVTNTLATDAVMHLHVIDGDEGSNWGEQDIYCGMTPNETTLVLFQNNGVGPRMKVECSNVGRAFLAATDIVDFQPGTVTSIPVAGDRGVLVINEVLVADEGLTDLTQNRFISDWTTVDLANGTAISAESLHLQGPLGGMTNGQIDLTGKVPAVLGADFVAPTPGGEIQTEILLITLDGKPGTPPRQAVDGWVYNDDEIKQSWQTREWECMDYFSLTDLDASFVSNELCDANAPLGCVGHVVLNPIPVSVGGSVHDAPFAPFGGPGSETFRQSVFDGWIIHRFNPAGPLFPADGMALSGINNKAATARVLNRGMTVNSALPGDIFGLDLR